MIINVISPELESTLLAWELLGTTTPDHGTAVINKDQTITYTPNIGYFGEDEFEYVVKLTHKGGAVTNETASVKVTVNPSDTEVSSIITGAADLNCLNYTRVLNGISSTGEYPLTYAWTTQGGSIIGDRTLPLITVSTPGVYTLTVTDYEGNISSSDATVGENLQAPIVNIIKTPNTDQLTPEVQEIVLSADTSEVQGVPEYSWSTGETTSSILINKPGTYSVTVKDSANGCTEIESVVIIGEIIMPVASISGQNNISCSNPTITLNGSNSTGHEITYMWSTVGGNILSVPTQPSITIDKAGEYRLTVTDSKQNTDYIVVEILDVTTEITAEITSSDIALSETVQSIDLNVDITGSVNVSYLWSTGEVTPNINITTPGIYSVTVTDIASGCTADTLIEITEEYTGAIAVITGATEINFNTPTGTLDASSSSGVGELSYEWTASNGGTYEGTPTGITATYTSAGTYRLTVTDSNGSTDFTEVTVTSNYLVPTIDAGVADTQLSCAVPSIQLNATATSNNPTANLVYLWTGGSIVSGGTTLTPIVSRVATYLLEVKDLDNGAVSFDTVQVKGDTTLPIAEAGEPVTLDSTTLTAVLDGTGSTVDGVTYEWIGGTIDSGGDTLTPTVSAAGEYTLIVTNTTSGCESRDTVTVSAPPEPINTTVPEVDAGEGGELTCSVDHVTLTGVVSSANPDSQLTHRWTGGSISGSRSELVINALLAGTYTLTVTDNNNGLSASDTVEVTSNAGVPSLSVTGDPVDLVINNENPIITLTATSDAQNPTYVWTTSTGNIVSGQGTSSIEVDKKGTYNVKVTNGVTDCYASLNTVVTYEEIPVSASISGSNKLCEDDVDTRVVTQITEDTYIRLYYDDSGNIPYLLDVMTKMKDEPNFLESLLVPKYKSVSNYRFHVSLHAASTSGGSEASLRHLNINDDPLPGSNVISIVFQDEEASGYYSNTNPTSPGPNYLLDYPIFKSRLDNELKGKYNGIVMRLGNNTSYSQFLSAVRSNTNGFVDNGLKDYPEIIFRGVNVGIPIPPLNATDQQLSSFAANYTNEIKQALIALGFNF